MNSLIYIFIIAFAILILIILFYTISRIYEKEKKMEIKYDVMIDSNI